MTPSHFALLRTPLVAGRGFDRSDTSQGRRAVIVNESAARRLWPGQDAVGHRLALFFANGANTEEREVVGVVRDIRFDPIEDAAAPDVYLPAAQTAWGSAIVFVRAGVPQEALSRAISAEVARLDPDLPLYDVKPLVARLGAGFAAERFVATVLAAFASGTGAARRLNAAETVNFNVRDQRGSKTHDSRTRAGRANQRLHHRGTEITENNSVLLRFL